MPVKMRTTVWLTAALAVSVAGAPTGRSVDLAVTGLNNANASVAAAGSMVAIAWGASSEGGATDIYLATSRDGGLTFGGPRRVNDAGSRASLSGEQPPRVTLVPRPGADPSIVVVWTARGTMGTRLLAAKSDDGGRTFARPAAVPGSNAPGNRGWHAIATDRDGRVVTVWLDHRDLARASSSAADTNPSSHDHSAHQPQPGDGAARAQPSKLFFSMTDGAGTARALTGGVCYCCKTAVAAGADGSVYIAWRHVYPGNVRDIAFTMSRDRGRTFSAPTRVSDDRWVLDGCPENGPSLAVDDRQRIHVVWPTLVAGATPRSEPTLALFYATSTDGRLFTPRQRLPTEGFPRHPQIALDARGIPVVTWDEQASGIRRVALARGTADGKGLVRFTRQVIGDTAPATYPVVATTGEGIVVAWTSGSASTSVLRTERLAQ